MTAELVSRLKMVAKANLAVKKEAVTPIQTVKPAQSFPCT